MTPKHSSITLRARAAFSLLEVLVACGILVVALASIAALLPAAGSRLGEASAQDRAAATAAAAMVEIQARGLAAKGIFPTGTWADTPVPFYPCGVVFGEVLSLAVTSSATSTGYVTTSGSLAVTATSGSIALTNSGTVFVQALLSGSAPVLSTPIPSFVASRISTDTLTPTRRGFFLEDEVQFAPSATGNLPANWFENGPRQFNRGVCWGALITPYPPGPASQSMTALKTSIAVFKKPDGNVQAITLRSLSSESDNATGFGVFCTSGTLPRSLQRTLLAPCSKVLAIPPQAVSGSTSPQWLSIRSSWIATGTMVGTSGTTVGVSGTNVAIVASSGTAPTCLTFSGSVPRALYSGTPATLNVIGFENLLLVIEQTFPVQ